MSALGDFSENATIKAVARVMQIVGIPVCGFFAMMIYNATVDLYRRVDVNHIEVLQNQITMTSVNASQDVRITNLEMAVGEFRSSLNNINEYIRDHKVK